MERETLGRRTFLKRMLFGAGAFFIATTPIDILAKSSSQPLGSEKILSLLRTAKNHFYRKEYNAAIAIYQQLITNDPRNIVFYDGYAKVLKALQKLPQATELYIQGLKKNPKQPPFMHRAALSIHTLALAHQPAAEQLQNQYGSKLLTESAIELLLDAITISKRSVYLKLSLLDMMQSVDQYNITAAKRYRQKIEISSDQKAKIASYKDSVATRWHKNRTQEVLTLQKAEQNITRFNQPFRRELYDKKEKQEREKMMIKETKHKLSFALNYSIDHKNTPDVERYALLILEKDVIDTQTIGRVVHYYKKEKAYDRCISLYRYLHSKNPSLQNKLALASVLSKYNVGASAETMSYLSFVRPYLTTLPLVSSVTYYLSLSRVKKHQGDIAGVREVLSEGMALLREKQALLYTLLEHYALSFMEEDPAKGIAILNVIANKTDPEKLLDQIIPKGKARSTSLSTDSSTQEVIPYIVSYQNGKIPSVEEQLKPLYAMARMYKETNLQLYNETLQKIRSLQPPS